METKQDIDSEQESLLLAEAAEDPQRLRDALLRLERSCEAVHKIRGIFIEAFRKCIVMNHPERISVLWRESQSMSRLQARSIDTMEVLLQLGRREEAETILAILDVHNIGGEALKLKLIKLLMVLGRKDQALPLLIGSIERGDSGTTEVNGIVHDMMRAGELAIAKTTWGIIQQYCVNPVLLKTMGATLKKRFGNVFSEQPYAIGEQKVEIPKEPFNERWLREWGKILSKDRSDRTLCIAMSTTHIAPSEWGKKLWLVILKNDPGRKKVYIKFLKKQNLLGPPAADRSLDQKVHLLNNTIPTLDALKALLPTSNEEDLHPSHFTAMKQLAAAAGRDGGRTRDYFEDLVELLETRKLLGRNGVSQLRCLLEKSICRFHRTEDPSSQGRYTRSVAFRSLQETPPKTMPKFFTGESRRALTNTSDSTGVRNGKIKRKRGG